MNRVIYNFLKMNLDLLRCFVYRSYTCLYSLFYRQQDKVLFVSYNGKQYSDNPRAISEELHKTLGDDVEIVWAFNKGVDKTNVPSYVVSIKSNSFEFYRELATCKVYVTNNDIRSNICKRKGQLFIQTFHGDRGFKKCLYEEKRLWIPPIIDNKVTDFCVAGSSYGEEILFRKMFRYYGKILKVGCPRNDCLFNNDVDYINTVRDKLKIPSKVKVLLYAPTFRDNGLTYGNSLNIIKVLSELSKDGDEWICLVRAHHIAKKNTMSDIFDGFIDVSSYHDMADLLMISDMLITDYSSSAGDFALTEKPVVLFLNDISLYESHCRKFVVDPRDTPFLVAYDTEDICNIIGTKKKSDYIEANKKVRDFYGTYEKGEASRRVVAEIEKFLKE